MSWMFKVLSICAALSLCAEVKQETAAIKSPEEIQKELDQAEQDFKDAYQMFNPWYTGPILAPSAHLMPPGSYNIQPYLFITGDYGKYQASGSLKKTPTQYTLNPVFIAQFGMLDWVDSVITIQGIYNHLNGHGDFNIGDLPISLGFQLLKEKPYRPAILISVKEQFPTGKYQRLDPEKEGVDSTGSGSYQTSFYLNASKVIWWLSYKHPMAVRLSLQYTIPSTVKVKGFNTYGGGHGTNGKVHPGQSFSADFGYEYSFTQNWAAALDIVYTYAKATHFSGVKGVLADGTQASIGGPFNDQLSLAPAIEYNWNENLGFIGGLWFSVWGRNSTAFASGVLSVVYTF